ncbi:MAG: glycerol-3-phosphate acyltransferase PlsX [Flavobacteriales bacterium]|jgi:glycerol-3-phosphate acyltransferase PlsX
MGGDSGPQPYVTAVEQFVGDFPDTHIHIVGKRTELDCLRQFPVPDRLVFVDAGDVVSMSDVPSATLRHKRESSMWKAISLVASGDADACVSPGNTGALMAMSLHLIKTLPGIKRPAICKPIPTQCGSCYLLDLGANLDCSAENLVQFALMGAALAKVSGIDKPKLALLNVGSETNKGSSHIQQAAIEIAEFPDISYEGFVEGGDLFSGSVDVIVCDGFVGNVALKVSEGLVRFIMDSLYDFLHKSISGRIVMWGVGFFLRRWSQRYNPSLYNGAAFLGLRKTVVKSHGSADSLAFYKALEAARDHVLAEIPQKIDQSVQASLHRT